MFLQINHPNIFRKRTWPARSNVQVLLTSRAKLCLLIILWAGKNTGEIVGLQCIVLLSIALDGSWITIETGIDRRSVLLKTVAFKPALLSCNPPIGATSSLRAKYSNLGASSCACASASARAAVVLKEEVMMVSSTRLQSKLDGSRACCGTGLRSGKRTMLDSSTVDCSRCPVAAIAGNFLSHIVLYSSVRFSSGACRGHANILSQIRLTRRT